MSEQKCFQYNAGLLPQSQFAATSFVYHSFTPKTWASLDGVQCSLLGPGIRPQASDEAFSRYERFVIATTILENLRVERGAALADDVVFKNVPPGTQTTSLLIHQGPKLIAHMGHAAGLPLWADGGDVHVVWDKGPNKIFMIER